MGLKDGIRFKDRPSLLLEIFLLFQKDKDIEDRLYIKHPNNLTKWFAVNNYDALHAADLPTDPDRKIIMTISGELDIVKHREILKRSLEKFKDYIITL